MWSFIPVVISFIWSKASRFGFSGARTSARALGTEKRESYPSGNYSTVKSAQRLSATLSIRPGGRVRTIDTLLGSILVCQDYTSGFCKLAIFSK